MPRTEAARLRYEERKAQGLCVICGQKSDGQTKCPSCRNGQKASRSKTLAKKADTGQCSACSNEAKTGCKLCQSCIDQRSKTSSEHYQKRKEAGTCHYCKADPLPGYKSCEYHLQKQRDHRWALKADALLAYGGPVCSSCGVDDPEVLNIDHIEGGGRKHRQAENIEGGLAFYQWLKNNDYPEGFRVLCANCNWKAHRTKLKEE